MFQINNTCKQDQFRKKGLIQNNQNNYLFHWCFLLCSRMFQICDDDMQYDGRKPTTICRSVQDLLTYGSRGSLSELNLNSQQLH